jgi:cysteine desulfurase / selenocysteine lyase
VTAGAAAGQIAPTYDAVARLLGCAADEVALTDIATRAWDMAFYGVPLQAGDRVLGSKAEYASNVIALLQVAARTGAVMEVVDDDEHGQLSIADLRRRVDRATGIGVPARCLPVGRPAAVDVGRIGCDMLSATGRTFLRGPRGTGFLYVRRTMLHRLEPPLLDLHAATRTAPDRYELFNPTPAGSRPGRTTWPRASASVSPWTTPCPGAWRRARPAVGALAAGLRERLQALSGVRVHDQGQRRCGIVTFTVDGVVAGQVRQHLREQGVRTTVSRARSAQLDLPDRGLAELVRTSVHHNNTEEELEALVPRPARPHAVIRRSLAAVGRRGAGAHRPHERRGPGGSLHRGPVANRDVSRAGPAAARRPMGGRRRTAARRRPGARRR